MRRIHKKCKSSMRVFSWSDAGYIRLLPAASLPIMLFGYLSCIKFYQHSSISLHFFKGHRQAEVVQQQELQFQMIKLHQWEATNLQHVSGEDSIVVTSSQRTFAYLELV